MDEFYLDKLIGNGLAASGADDEFKQQVLRESTGALTRAVLLRRRLRTTGLTLGVLLIAAGAFILGQSSASTSGGVSGEQRGRTSVPAELVAWLDTARFFDRLGMQERAGRAYEQAGVLVPYESSESWQARSWQKESFSCVLANISGDGSFGRPHERTDSSQVIEAAEPKLKWPNKGLNRVVAQCLGD